MYTELVTHSIEALGYETYWRLRLPKYIRTDIDTPLPLTLIEI